MLGHGIIGESTGICINGIPERGTSGLNHIGLWFNPEPRTQAFDCGVNPEISLSINGLTENPAGFFDFAFFTGRLYIPILFLIYFMHLAFTIRFYS